MVTNQAVNISGKEVALSELMSLVKGYLTVNTPSINQAILGGILIKNNFSFKRINRDKIANLKEKREMILKCLEIYCKIGSPLGEQLIKWNLPLGGFFLTIFVPFKINGLDVLICADKFKVIFTPMSFFYFNGGGENEIRIAFSNIKIENIAPAIKRLGEYFKFKISQKVN
jgi:(S)-3,5-dihydroxyphenylglycine transaminase